MSMTRWEYYKKQQAHPDVGVGNVLDPDRASLVQNNHDYMKTLLQYHRYFCAEEMAYREHDETNESLNMQERGNNLSKLCYPQTRRL